jgi:hypothetical protein
MMKPCALAGGGHTHEKKAACKNGSPKKCRKIKTNGENTQKQTTKTHTRLFLVVVVGGRRLGR